jgi:hypothetical protein
VAAFIAVAILSVLTMAAGGEDDIPVWFEGRVQWTAGDTLTVATDNDQSISIDLGHVPQYEYQRLRSNDRIVVTGSISPEQSRVVATSIEALDPFAARLSPPYFGGVGRSTLRLRELLKPPHRQPPSKEQQDKTVNSMSRPRYTTADDGPVSGASGELVVDPLAESIIYLCALIADRPRAIDRYIDYFGETRPAAGMAALKKAILTSAS